MRCTIVVPIYKTNLSNFELCSLTQVFTILKQYPFAIIMPETYRGNTELINSVQRIGTQAKEIQFYHFNDEAFYSIESYNKLLVNKSFYERFSDYEYMLICQLDAFVFKDVLADFLQINFDYIGAPWFEGYDEADENSKLLGIAGNGGFSLRKISSFIKVLEHDTIRIESFRDIFKRYKNRSIIRKISKLPKMLTEYARDNTVGSVGNKQCLLEDTFWAKFAPRILPSFITAPIDIAIKFAFEVNPRILFTMNHNELPFGCHAWWRYDLTFWKPFIKSFGYNI